MYCIYFWRGVQDGYGLVLDLGGGGRPDAGAFKSHQRVQHREDGQSMKFILQWNVVTNERCLR